MNSKITFTERTIDILRSHDWSHDEAKSSCSIDAINKLLIIYAEKAVDFPIVYVTASESGAVFVM